MQPIEPLLASQANSEVIRIPAGDWSVSRTITLNGRVLVGEYRRTRLFPSPKITCIEIQSPHNRSRTATGEYVPNGMGAGVVGLEIWGTRQGQTGITTSGPCDLLQISNVMISDCDGGGLVLNPVSGFTRESTIDQLYIMRCGDATHAACAVLHSSNGDGANNIRFRDCSVVYSYGIGVLIQNKVTTETIRAINWHGGLIHWIGGASKLPGHSLLSIQGKVRSVVFAPDKWTGCTAGIPAVVYDAKAHPPLCSGSWSSDGGVFGSVDMSRIVPG